MAAIAAYYFQITLHTANVGGHKFNVNDNCGRYADMRGPYRDPFFAALLPHLGQRGPVLAVVLRTCGSITAFPRRRHYQRLNYTDTTQVSELAHSGYTSCY